MKHLGCFLALVFISCATPDPGTIKNTDTQGLTVHYIEHGERIRSYALYTPSALPQGKAVPLMISFHGAAGNYKAQVHMSQFNPVADKHKFYVVYPNGTGRLDEALLTFNAGFCCGYSWKKKIDDIGFVNAILNDLAQKNFAIDSKRIYASGMSNGAMMTYAVGCELSDKIAAIGPVAGASIMECPKLKRPMPIFHVHGLKDTFYPYEGKKMDNRHVAEGDFPSIDEAVRGWVRMNNAVSTPEVTKTKHFVKTVYKAKESAKSAPVVVVTIPNGGHTWPGGGEPKIDLGPHILDVPVSEMMWEFLSQFHL